MSELKPLPRSKAKDAYELLDDVIRVIEEEPKRLNMNEWLRKYDPVQVAAYEELPSCGTVACIAGWMSVLKPTRNQVTGRMSVEAFGQHLLNTVRSFEVYSLFHTFPEAEEPGTKEYATAVIRRIRYFQSEFKTQLKARKF